MGTNSTFTTVTHAQNAALIVHIEPTKHNKQRQIQVYVIAYIKCLLTNQLALYNYMSSAHYKTILLLC